MARENGRKHLIKLVLLLMNIMEIMKVIKNVAMENSNGLLGIPIKGTIMMMKEMAMEK